MVMLLFWVIAPGLVLAQISEEDRKAINLDTVWHKNYKNICVGNSGGDPLFGPFYPAVSDGAALTESIRNYISTTRPDSPLIDHVSSFVKYGDEFNVNPALVVAIAQQETSLGTAGYAAPPQYNVFNVRNGPGGSFGSYASYDDSIRSNFELLAGDLYLGPPSNFTSTEQIMNRYAPPSDGNATSEYVEFVDDVIQKIIGGAQGNVGTQPNSCSGTGSGGSGIVSANGYSFPVGPQKQSENGTQPGLSAMPCGGATCHHDGTGALDLGRAPGGDDSAGAPVYAISDGNIEYVRDYMGIEGCYMLEVRSSIDGMYYWYGHVQNPVVQPGQQVKAGDQVAEIGVRACTGNGSNPHLHIDRGCSIAGQPQHGGLVDCRDPDFVPFMNDLFASLPP